MDSTAMVNACFRHQHPDAYGEPEIAEPMVPIDIRYGRDSLPPPSTSCLTEELLAYPGVRPLEEYPA